MNLKTHIHEEMWNAISNSYEAENYMHSILDAIHYLSDVIRNKANLDGDGVSLVGAAFGGDDPKLRINKLQTESDKDAQRGLLQFLLGIYTGIRNPRSHENIEDTKDTADSIIFFIDYLIAMIGQAEEPFTVNSFLKKVLDPDFVPSEKYASLLANEVPEKKRLDTLIEVWRSRTEGDSANLSYISHSLLKELSESEVDEFMRIVSKDLMEVSKFQEISTSFKLLTPELWDRVREAPRMRIENRIIKDIVNAEYDPNTDTLTNGKGALATWARSYFPMFKMKSKLSYALMDKIRKDMLDRAYVMKHFFSHLPGIIDESLQLPVLIEIIATAVKQNEVTVRDELVYAYWSMTSEWRKQVLASLKDLEKSDPEYLKKFDDIPF